MYGRIKKGRETIKLKGMVHVFERFDLAGKNGNFNIKCYVTAVPLFFVEEGTCRIRQGAGRLSHTIAVEETRLIYYRCK
ncbi:hypothetical protein B0T13DRAFT_398735 [Neurospora crassa]|nr:hypothetical protein B0T13DRAFT_398735 [Neurospora crassa]